MKLRISYGIILLAVGLVRSIGAPELDVSAPWSAFLARRADASTSGEDVTVTERSRASKCPILRFHNHLSTPIACIIERYEPVCVEADQDIVQQGVALEDPLATRVSVTRRVVFIAAQGTSDVTDYRCTEEQFYLGKIMRRQLAVRDILQRFTESSQGWQGPYQCVPIAYSSQDPIDVHISADTQNASAPMIIEADRAIITAGRSASSYVRCIRGARAGVPFAMSLREELARAPLTAA